VRSSRGIGRPAEPRRPRRHPRARGAGSDHLRVLRLHDDEEPARRGARVSLFIILPRPAGISLSLAGSTARSRSSRAPRVARAHAMRRRNHSAGTRRARYTPQPEKRWTESLGYGCRRNRDRLSEPSRRRIAAPPQAPDRPEIRGAPSPTSSRSARDRPLTVRPIYDQVTRGSRSGGRRRCIARMSGRDLGCSRPARAGCRVGCADVRTAGS